MITSYEGLLNHRNGIVFQALDIPVPFQITIHDLKALAFGVKDTELNIIHLPPIVKCSLSVIAHCQLLFNAGQNAD